MPAITATNMVGVGAKALTETTLDGSDSFTFNEYKNPILTFRNPTAGALTPVIDGDGGSTVNVQGLGVIDVSGGYSVGSIAIGGSKVVRVNTIKEHCQGTIAITGGTGLVATLMEF